MATDFKALDFSYEVQRSFANKIFSNKNVAKSFIDGNSAALLDELYKLIKIYTQSKKDSEKLVRNIIKISVKLGMLERSGRFSEAEQSSLLDIRRQLHTVAMTLISFHQVEHTYDRAFVADHLVYLRDDIKALVRPHLTDKSLGRVDHVFDFCSQADFLDSLYVPGKNKDVAAQMAVIMQMLNTCMEEGSL